MKTPPGRPVGGIGIPFKSFSKIRVVDFSRLLPGPYATQVLADMGCKVTRVELPYFADMTREFPPLIDGVGATYWMINQGKTRLLLDFRKPAGLKKARALIAKADVLIESFRPGVMEKSGLGYAELERLNPRLVYCSLAGYPEGSWEKKAGHDLNFLAMSGLLGLGDSEGKISFPAAQFADLSGSMAAVAGILAGLLESRARGRGRHLKISLAATIHSWLTIPLASWAATGQDTAPRSDWWNGAHPFYRLYPTMDGRHLAVAALEPVFFRSLLDALGLGHLKDLADDALANAQPLAASLAETFASATMAEWEPRLAGKDLCVTPVLSLGESARFWERERLGRRILGNPSVAKK